MSTQVVIIDKPKKPISLLKGILFTAALAVFGLAGLIQPAHAATVSTKTGFDRTFYISCTEFTDIEHYTGTETTRYFADGSQQTKEHVEAIFTNSVTGKTLSSSTNFLYSFGADGSLTISGPTFRLNVPGRGVSIDTGRTVYSANGVVVLNAGPSDSQPNLCQVLAN